MDSSQGAMALGMIAGALGGVASYLFVAFGAFKQIPTSKPSQSKSAIAQRSFFLIARVAFGFLTGLIVSFWFMDNYAAGHITSAKLFFTLALSGFSTTMLASLSDQARRLLG
jgi:hypothetical protein